MWILGSYSKELLFLYVPALVGIAVSFFFPDLGETSLLYGLFATAIVDSGHVYTTAWRTWLNPAERVSGHRYWVTPLACFLFFSLWSYYQVPGLWKFVVYATMFHHVRQAYGFSRWYQGLNHRFDPYSDYFLYALMLLPFIIFHFREGAGNIIYYSHEDLFVMPHAQGLKISSAIYLVVLFSWAFYERRNWRNGIREPNRLLSVAYPALIYGWCFIYGKTLTQVLFPMLFMHGIAYCGVMGTTLQKTQRERFQTFLKALVVIVATAIFFGLAETWFQEDVMRNMGQPLLISFGVGLILTPLFCHYIFDAWIWKRSHRESRAFI